MLTPNIDGVFSFFPADAGDYRARRQWRTTGSSASDDGLVRDERRAHQKLTTGGLDGERQPRAGQMKKLHYTMMSIYRKMMNRCNISLLLIE